MAFELLFILPVLVLILIACVQYAMWSAARQTVTSAAIDGTRVASAGGTLEETVNAVRKVLSANKMTLDKRNAVVVVQRGEARPEYFGNRRLCRLPRSRLRPGEVRVTVCLRGGARTPLWIRWSSNDPTLCASMLMSQ